MLGTKSFMMPYQRTRKTTTFCLLLIACLSSPGIQAQGQNGQNKNCICGSERDTVFAALNRGLQAQRAYQNLTLKYDSVNSSIPTTINHYEDKLQLALKQDQENAKKLRKTERNRNFWRGTTVISLLIALGLSLAI